MAYNADTNWANEEKYLNGLISQGGGNAAWAQNQMKELNAAKQQYGGAQSQPSAPSAANQYFPEANGQGRVPGGYQGRTDVYSGTTTAPNGDTLPMHNWATDQTDYSQQMMAATTLQEFLAAAQARENKANAQGKDILSGANGIRTNEQLYNEWAKKNGFQPNYGEFLTPGYGWDSTQEKFGWINNAGTEKGYYGMDGEGHWGYYADPGLTQKLQNGTWDKYASSDGGYVRLNERGPDLSERDPSRAGKTITMTSPKGTWECTYDENGNMTGWKRISNSYTPGLIPAKADNDRGVSSAELMNAQFGHSYTGPGSTINHNDITPATRADYAAVIAGRGQGDSSGMGGKLPGASGGMGSGAAGAGSSGASAGGSGMVSGIPNRAPDLQSTLDKWLAAAKAQAEQKVDYATQLGINELNRAEEDAQGKFQTQRNQIAADAAKAGDNQALYNERAGDRGGIGAAQYDSIANTAAQNQLTVNQAQTKLSTDTARQIADLRAQGEFTKADQLLQLSQTYLQQLISIQQWSAEFNLSVDQFNKQIEQWNHEYELKVSELLGSYRGQPTLGSQQLALNKNAQLFDQEYKTAGITGIFRGQPTLESRAALAEAGLALAQSGIQPSASQLEAMKTLYGYDSSAVNSLVQTAKLTAQAKLSGGKGYSGGSGKPGKTASGAPDIKTQTSQWLAYHGYDTYSDAYDALRLQGFDDDIAESRARAYMGEINKYVDSNTVTYDVYKGLYRTIQSMKQTKGLAAARSYFENNVLNSYVIPDRWLNDLMSLVGYKK